ncbi:MAG: hypothetical protein V4539_15580 [Bacteroidota bacterium]
MKKLLLILLVYATTSSYAQLEKGTKLVGLQFNLLVNDIYGAHTDLNFADKDYGLSISPTFGYALQRNWLVGAHAVLGFEYVKSSFPTYSITETSTDLGIAPFTRLYLDLTKDHKLKVFGLAALEIVNKNFHTKYNLSGGSTSSTTRNYGNVNGSLGAGFGYFGRKIVIDASASTTAIRLGFYKILGQRKK